MSKITPPVEPPEIQPNPSSRLIDVLFDGDHLVLADQNGQPYVVMRALAGALGLAWQPQHAKLVEKFGPTVTEIVTVADDGKPRSMTCLPLRKLPGWLYSLNPGKVAPELRKKIQRYQHECDEVLWNHWTGVYQPRTQADQVALSRLSLSYEREHLRVALELAKCQELGIGAVLFDKYQRLSAMLGARIIGIDQLAPALRQKRLALEAAAT
jgi:hypothetical protein